MGNLGKGTKNDSSNESNDDDHTQDQVLSWYTSDMCHLLMETKINVQKMLHFRKAPFAQPV